MTVTYTSKVTTCTGLGVFFRLLKRWRGSIYKIVWADLLLFVFIYYMLNITYLYALSGIGKRYFEKIVTYCAKYGSLIPLSFVLGFYVNIVYTRWWNQYTSIPFPDNLAILVGASIKGQDDKARIVRRTIVRYVCLAFTITLSMLSPRVKKRFPTLNHFLEAGLITAEEKRLMEQLDNDYPSYSKYWLPIAWAASITTRSRHEGVITEDLSVKGILDELNAFRTKCNRLLDYDWISIPLVYTQVVTLAVYSYFLVTVIGYQFIEGDNDNLAEIIVFSFPFMPVVEFFFYMGWLKVAETLINPFGDDDDDFEVVWMIDRHIQVCYLLVDKIHHEHPKLCKDIYFEEDTPTFLPFTVASQEYMTEYPEFSTDHIKIKNTDQDFVIPEYIPQQHFIFQTQPDGSEKEKGFWRSVNGSFVRSRKGMRGVALKRVSSHRIDRTSNNEVNTYEDADPNKVDDIPLFGQSSSTPLSQPGSMQPALEFVKLRQERLEKQKEKLLNYIQLVKVGRKEGEKLIDDIIK